MSYFTCNLLFQKAALGTASANGFDFVVTPMVHPRLRTPEVIAERRSDEAEITDLDDPSQVPARGYPFARSDLLLNSSDWTTLLVADLTREGNLDSGCAQVQIS